MFLAQIEAKQPWSAFMQCAETVARRYDPRRRCQTPFDLATSFWKILRLWSKQTVGNVFQTAKTPSAAWFWNPWMLPYLQATRCATLPTNGNRLAIGPHYSIWAFTIVGVDYSGPFAVKRGRGREKRYGCIFTCLTTRAVHIETADTLDTDSFINSLYRFMARRGEPRLVRSDNGTNFVGAERELRKEMETWNQKRIQEAMSQRGIRWLFNPPAASHMGGVWERQIRSVRRILFSIMTEQVPTSEMLTTLLVIAEGMINNRPLTPASDDPDDLEPLTPNHLLIHRPASVPPGLFNEGDLHCRKKWRQVQYLADVFWRRWTKEYLLTLRQRTKWHGPRRNVKTNDLVLVISSNTPRSSWQIGRVMETYEGADKLVCSARVRLKDTELVRPITKLQSNAYSANSLNHKIEHFHS